MKLGGLSSKFAALKFRHRAHQPLVRNYLLVFVSLVAGGMITSGVLDIYFRYYETQDQIFQLQSEAARGAVTRIAQFILEIERQMKFASLGLRLADRGARSEDYFELRRLLYVSPAISDIVLFDNAGLAQLSVSRFRAALPNESIDASKGEAFLQAKQGVTYFGTVYFLRGSDPYITMAVPVESYPGNVVGVLQAEVSLRFVGDIIRDRGRGDGSYTYIVTRPGDIIAHSNSSSVLQRKKADHLSQVRAALRPAPAVPEPESMLARSLTGEKVLSSYAYLPNLDWAVIVERPVSEAYHGLYTSLLRTSTLLLVGFGIALLAAAYMARRVVRPLQQLSLGADRIAGGDWNFRLDIRTGDEIEMLAHRFNGMVSELKKSYQDLEERVAQRTKELSALFDLTAAAAQSLEIVPVLQKVVAKVCETFGFDGSRIFLFDRGREALKLSAFCGLDPGHVGPEVLEPKQGLVDTVAQKGVPVVVEDVRSDPRYRALTDSHAASQMAQVFLAAFPIKGKGECLGILVCHESQRRKLSRDELRLITVMTDQIGVAIEKINLFEQVKSKTTELESANAEILETLEGQTAVAGLLRVMTSSRSDLQNLLDSINERAVTLARAKAGVIRLKESGRLGFVAHYRNGGSFLQELQKLPERPDEDSATTRAMREGKPVQVLDIKNPASGYRGPVEETFARTVLAVPMVRENAAIGAIVIYRDVVNPFNKREIELVRTFADQAVIAIENVRLFQSLAARTNVLSTLYDVTTQANQSLDLSIVLHEVIRKFTQTFRFDATWVLLLAREGGDLILRSAIGSNGSKRGPRAIALGEGIIGRVAESGDPIVFDDIQTDPLYEALSRTKGSKKDGYRFEAVFPIRSKGRLLGVVFCVNRQKRMLSGDEVDLIQSVLDPIGVAIENLELFEELKLKTQALEDANQELVAASEHKSQFLADVSHELRTPLTVIKGSVDNMLDGLTGEFNERQSRYLTRLRMNVDRLTRLINDLLDISRIESGVVELHPTFFDVVQLMREVSDSLRPLAEEKQIAVKLIASDRELTAWGDRSRISQVLINLLNNAFQYSPPTRTVTLGAKQDAVHGVEISISDQGPGIDPEHREKIFEKFYRVDDFDGSQHLGAGLGLNIAQNFVKLHGGKIWVDSEVGKGSTFFFTLSTRFTTQMQPSLAV